MVREFGDTDAPRRAAEIALTAHRTIDMNTFMPSTNNIQASRYEFKYIIDEPIATEVFRFIRNYVQPDAHTVGREGRGYPVHSLYLDSTDFFTCRATLHGEKTASNFDCVSTTTI